MNPCQGEPLLDERGRPRLCNPSNPCPNSHWCHIGVAQATTVCCPSGTLLSPIITRFGLATPLL